MENPIKLVHKFNKEAGDYYLELAKQKEIINETQKAIL